MTTSQRPCQQTPSSSNHAAVEMEGCLGGQKPVISSKSVDARRKPKVLDPETQRHSSIAQHSVDDDRQ